MKKSRKLVSAIALLMISALMLSTASYAWFSMNNTVTATGMDVNAVADSSLVIKGETDDDFTSIGTNELEETELKPSTSYDGLNFGRLADAVKVESAAAFDATWTGTDGAFQASDLVKVTGTEVDADKEPISYYATTEYTLKNIQEDAKVYVKSITLTQDDSATETIINAVRVSVTMGDTTLVFNPKGGTAATVGKYAGSAWSLAAPSYTTVNTSDALLGELTADEETAVTINIWFEGQDEDCFSDNVSTKNISLEVQFTTLEP